MIDLQPVDGRFKQARRPAISGAVIRCISPPFSGFPIELGAAPSSRRSAFLLVALAV